MKKRLLSAALALAMVLTMLPLTAFAADAAVVSGKTQVTYYDKNDASKGIPGHDSPGWYYSYRDGSVTRYEKLNAVSGVINNASGNKSGTYYDMTELYNANGTLKFTNITLLSDINLGTVTQNIRVDVNGHNLTMSVDYNAVTTLNVTDTQYSSARENKLPNPIQGSVSGIDNANSAKTFTLTVSGAQVSGGINLTGAGTHTVTLDKYASVSGNITMSGYTTDASSSRQARQALTATDATISGNIEVLGNGSQIKLTNVNADVNGSTSAVTLKGSATAMEVSGITQLGDVTLFGSDNVDGRAPTGAAPKLTMKGGKVGAVNGANGEYEKLTGNYSIDIGSNSTTGAITMDRANVIVRSNAATGAVTVDAGSLEIAGPRATLGAVSLAADGQTVLKVSGTELVVGGITAVNGSKLSISSWPNAKDGRTSNFGNLNLGNYTGKGVKGGVFTNAIGTADEAKWMDSSLQFAVKNGAKWVLYDKTELSQAISDIGVANAAVLGNIRMVGQGTDKTIVLKRGNTDLAKIQFSEATGLLLPEMIAGVGYLTWTGTNGAVLPAGRTVTIPADSEVVLNSQVTSTSITKLTNARVDNNDVNSNIRATVSGTVISLSGAVTVNQGSIASFKLILTTDVLDANDHYKEIDAWVFYNSATKKVEFSELSALDTGVTIQNGGLRLPNGVIYTLNGSGLAMPAANLKTYTSSTEIRATVTDNTLNAGQKALVVDALQAGQFTWNQSPAILQAVNAAQKTITNDSTLANWIKNAKTNEWKKYNTGNPTQAQLDTVVGYDTVWLVPYLNVTVTRWGQNGTFTANLVPSYRVVVSDSNNCNLQTAYEVQAGRALDSLTGELYYSGKVNSAPMVQLQVPSMYQENFNDFYYLYQDDTFVYSPNADGITARKYVLTHAGRTGLGTVTFSKEAPPVVLYDDENRSVVKGMYKTLQSAVDDAENLDYIEIQGFYTGSGVINMTGLARTVYIRSLGNTTVTANASGVTVKEDPRVDHYYTVQLLRSTVSTEGTVTINVGTAVGGTASVSASRANPGQVITVTVAPSAGYICYGLNVRTNYGENVSYSNGVTANTYTFTVPTGATNVTVTPSFNRTNGGNSGTTGTATVNVANTAYGTAITNAGTNTVTGGSVVTVTTAPYANYRTMGVSVRADNYGTVRATRTGVNNFTFTVPTGATNVTVTPTFDVNNGTTFEDVWSTEYYSSAVGWAVSRGITNGKDTYTFGSYDTCNRQDMVTFLWRAAGSPKVGNVTNPFVDVSPSAYYYDAVMWAVSKGITNGVERNRFGVNQPVDRAQAVTFLYRYEGAPAAGNSSFGDVSSRAYYAKAVAWAVSKGVTNGTSSTAFSPNSACQRCQVVTFLYRDIVG